MNTIDFKTSAYFPGTILFLGVLLGIVGLFIVITKTIVGLILILLCLIIFTTHYRLKIDFDSKEFYEYLWILGIKHGDKGKFETMEYLFITKNKISQTMNHMAGSSTLKKEVYDGYLKFSETSKIHLATFDHKKDLLKKLHAISIQLKVGILDYSEGEPKEI